MTKTVTAQGGAKFEIYRNKLNNLIRNSKTIGDVIYIATYKLG